jgi:hypothetical protein
MAKKKSVTPEKLEQSPVEEKPKKEKSGEKKKDVPPHVQAVIDMRRDIVASLVARGMRQTEITKQLGSPKIIRNGTAVDNPSYLVNPETGEPFDKATINRDVMALKTRWRKSADFNADGAFGRQLAEIDEIKRRMWAKDDIWGVARAVELEIKLMGTAKPQKLEHRWDDKQLGKVDKMAELFKMMREREAKGGSNGD